MYFANDIDIFVNFVDHENTHFEYKIYKYGHMKKCCIFRIRAFVYMMENMSRAVSMSDRMSFSMVYAR